MMPRPLNLPKASTGRGRTDIGPWSALHGGSGGPPTGAVHDCRRQRRPDSLDLQPGRNALAQDPLGARRSAVTRLGDPSPTVSSGASMRSLASSAGNSTTKPMTELVSASVRSWYSEKSTDDPGGSLADDLVLLADQEHGCYWFASLVVKVF